MIRWGVEQSSDKRGDMYAVPAVAARSPDLAGAAAAAGALSISAFLGNGAAQAAVAFNFAQSIGVIFTGSVWPSLSAV
jgi:hypothetical protein